MKNKISIIVPVYKVEAYLERCVDSLLNQTYDNIEIILVNDGSPDNSGKICDDYAKKYDRVCVIHKKNEGSSCARNAGLNVATGDFIAFVDSDDYILNDMFEKMISLSLEHDLDVVEVSSKNYTDTCSYDDTFVIENRNEAIERTISKTSFSVWRRIYKKTLVEDLRFIPKIIHQDVFYTMDVLNRTNFVGFLNTPLYIYNNLDESIIRSKYSEHKIKIGIKATEYIKNSLPKNNEKLKLVFNNYLINYYTDHFFLLSRNTSVDPNKIYRRKLKKEIKLSLKSSSSNSLRPMMVSLLPIQVMVIITNSYEILKKLTN